MRASLLNSASKSWKNSASVPTPMPLNKDLREFVALLNSHQVEFLIVGAYAVAFHGYPRYTGDLDILVRPDADNARRRLPRTIPLRWTSPARPRIWTG